MAEAKHGRRAPHLVAASLSAVLLIAVTLAVAGAAGSRHPGSAGLHSQGRRPTDARARDRTG